MKNHKTRGKKRTSKKYNKAQFRRFSKKTNRTRTMKGGLISNFFKRKPPEYYDNWIHKCETLITDLENDTTYPERYPNRGSDLKPLRLEIIKDALQNFREKKTVDNSIITNLLNPLIAYYDNIKNRDATPLESLRQQTRSDVIIPTPVVGNQQQEPPQLDVESGVTNQQEPPQLDVESGVTNQQILSESNVITQEDESLFEKLTNYFGQSKVQARPPRIGARKHGLNHPFNYENEITYGQELSNDINRSSLEKVMGRVAAARFKNDKVFQNNESFGTEKTGGKSKHTFKRNVKSKKKRKN